MSNLIELSFRSFCYRKITPYPSHQKIDYHRSDSDGMAISFIPAATWAYESSLPFLNARMKPIATSFRWFASVPIFASIALLGLRSGLLSTARSSKRRETASGVENRTVHATAKHILKREQGASPSIVRAAQ